MKINGLAARGRNRTGDLIICYSTASLSITVCEIAGVNGYLDNCRTQRTNQKSELCEGWESKMKITATSELYAAIISEAHLIYLDYYENFDRLINRSTSYPLAERAEIIEIFTIQHTHLGMTPD